jgi:hypothetical protein
MRTALYISAGLIALAAAFYAGTFFPHVHAVPPDQRPAIAAIVAAKPADDPVKRLQLDTLCGQSAAAYASEHELKGLGSQNEFEHGYNSRLGKCFILLRSFFSAAALGSNYSMEEDWLADATDGTDYGDYRVKNGPTEGNELKRTVLLCSVFPDGATLHLCVNSEQWKAYTGTMLHG